MTILAIDPALATIGYAFMDDSATQLIDYGVIKTSSKISVEERLDQIYKDVSSVIETKKPGQVCIETPFTRSVKSNTSVLFCALGVIRLAVWRSGVMPVFISPSQTKHAATGKGNAEKAQVIESVRLLFNLQDLKAPDDVFDAIAIGFAHSKGYSADTHHSQGMKKRKAA